MLSLQVRVKTLTLCELHDQIDVLWCIDGLKELDDVRVRQP